MIVQLLIGHPGSRPGGLALTIVYFQLAAGSSLVLGYIYAVLCARWPRASMVIQAVAAVLRGVPLLLLAFILATATSLPVYLAGFVALTLYSLTHVGEIIRSFLLAYPMELREQAKVMGLGVVADIVRCRLPRTFAYALDALTTHWVSLLKDTGALVVLSIAELTSVAKVLSEGRVTGSGWLTILGSAGLLYLVTTLALLRLLGAVRRRVVPFGPATVGFAATNHAAAALVRSPAGLGLPRSADA